MKRYIHSNENIMAMANVNRKRTGLNVDIWSDGQGCTRNKPNVVPRVKIMDKNEGVSISIETDPKVLAPKEWQKKFKKSVVKAIEEGIDYVGRNSDIFLKHYMDTDFSFDDSDLFEELKRRGDYK